jgi:hypothetical protein
VSRPTDPGPEQAIRALLVAASEGGPPTTDLLSKVRRRTRRRRVLMPSLATLSAVGVVAAVVVMAPTVTSAPSAQASAGELVAAAVTRTAQDGYRVRAESSKTAGSRAERSITEGVFDPVRRSGRMVAVAPDKGHVTIHVGDLVYVQIPADLVGRQDGIPKRARWLLRSTGYPRDAGISELAEFGGRALQNPRQALDWVRSAGDVREQGRASGDGWVGVRYAFTLTDRDWLVTGTVDVDSDGRVRRLEFTSRAKDTAWATARGVGATVHAALTFWDFGVQEPVTVPPADQVYRMPDPQDLKRELEDRRRRR